MMVKGSVLRRARDLAIARYESLPGAAQDLVCSAYGVQELVRRRGRLQDARKRMEVIESLHWSSVEARELVERRLRAILNLARGLPGYVPVAPSPSGASALEELTQWPVLRKDDLRRFPLGYLARSPGPTDIFSLTSGTSGTPLKVWRPRDTFRELFRSSAVSREWFGVPIRFRRASFTGKLVVPLASRRVWRMNLPGRQLVLSQYHLGPSNVQAYAAALRRWRPHVLDGYASNLVELAGLLSDADIRVGIPLVVTTCEVLTPAGRALLEKVFQGRVADKYGTSENVVLAAECPDGSRHVFQNVGVIEVADEEGRRVRDGQTGRLLLTTLTNDLMPLIRYDVGDLGTLEEPGHCACGRASPILAEVQGREDDIVIAPDGRRIGILAFNLLRGLEGVVQMQLVQEGTRTFLVRASLERDSVGAREPFESAVRQAFDRLVGADPERDVRFDFDGAIERTPGGKVRNVVRAF
jgi:phenylacetate-CoA ligase